MQKQKIDKDSFVILGEMDSNKEAIQALKVKFDQTQKYIEESIEIADKKCQDKAKSMKVKFDKLYNDQLEQIKTQKDLFDVEIDEFM